MTTTEQDDHINAVNRGVPLRHERYTIAFSGQSEKRKIIPRDVKVIGLENWIENDFIFCVEKATLESVAGDFIDPVLTSSTTEILKAADGSIPGVFGLAQEDEFNVLVIKEALGADVTGNIYLRTGHGEANNLFSSDVNVSALSDVP